MRRVVPVISMLVLLGSSLSAAQSMRSRSASIRGTILPAAGEGRVPDSIKVTLTSRTGEFGTQTTMAPLGLFEFIGLEAGMYHLTIESPGYETMVRVFHVEGSLRGEVVQLTVSMGNNLLPHDSLPPKDAAKTVSAEWLAVPQEAREEMAEAARASQKGDHEAAIRHLERALQIDPGLSQALNNLAIQYQKLSRSKEAIATLQRALEVNADDVLASRNLGSLYFQQGKFLEALMVLRHAYEVEPNQEKTLSLLGETCFRLGRFEEALNYFHKATAVAPARYQYLLRSAACNIELRRYGAAADLIHEFLQERPDDPRAKDLKSLVTRLSPP